VAEIVRIVNEATNASIDPRWIPAGVVRAVGLPLAAMMSVFKPGSEVCADLVRTMLHGHRFSNARSQDDLGLVYTSIESTISRTLQWFEDEGLLLDRS
jgi:dihydroflavonol-4-reductase